MAQSRDKRQTWQHEDNKELITCWLLFNSNQRGFLKRLHPLWTERNPGRSASEQLLAGQVRAVLQRKEFSDLELDELRRGLGLLSDDKTCSIVEEPGVEAIPTQATVTSNLIVGEVSSDSAELNQSCEVSNEEVDYHVSQEARPLYDTCKLKLYLMQQDSVPNGLCLPSFENSQEK